MGEMVRRWLIKANHDLKAAEIILSLKETLTETICFHCQQASEKYLKAFLTHNKTVFPKTHDLKYIQVLCADFNKDFNNLDLSGLTIYAVEIRYPEEFYSPTLEEAKQAYEKAKAVRDFVLNLLSVDKEDLSLF